MVLVEFKMILLTDCNYERFASNIDHSVFSIKPVNLNNSR